MHEMLRKVFFFFSPWHTFLSQLLVEIAQHDNTNFYKSIIWSHMRYRINVTLLTRVLIWNANQGCQQTNRNKSSTNVWNNYALVFDWKLIHYQNQFQKNNKSDQIIQFVLFVNNE